MRKAFFTLTLIVTGLYLALHLALGSSPVQRRVVEEIRKALSQFGLDLQIESIEFSALTPKIYLNRVTIRSLANAEVKLPNPIAIDKLKIEFQPLALISKQLVIEETVLFHPRVMVPSADQLYHKIDQFIKKQEKVVVKSDTGFTLVLKKIGVVDALFDISSKSPPFAVRSRSLTAFVQNTANNQQTVTIESNHLEIERGPLKQNLTKVEVDVDLTNKSLRVNRGIIQGDQLSVNLKGASSLPKNDGSISSLNFSYDVRVPLKLLGKFPEIKAPPVDGVVSSAGAIKIVNGSHGGGGTIRYENLKIDDFLINSGSLAYALSDKKISITNLDARYAQGEVTSKLVTIDLKDGYPIGGDLALKGVRLESLLDNLDQPGIPLRLGIDGAIKVSGTLDKPFNLMGDAKLKVSDFYVIADNAKGITPDNRVIYVPGGAVEGQLSFVEDRMNYSAKMSALQGSVSSEGYVAYEGYAKLRIKGDAVSLTGLKNIAELQLGGIANVTTEVEVVGKDARVTGSFDVTNGEIQNIVLGSVRGQGFFQNALLSFENLEAQTNLEPIRSNGFVDFNPDKPHFKFLVEGRRVETKKVFEAFQKIKLPFPQPTGGELTARLSIEGGHDADGVEIVAAGQSKNFSWYDEDWISSNFSFTFRTAYTELNRMLMFKKSGGLEVRGRFEESGANRLTFVSHGLRLEELSYLGKSPLAGEIVGNLTLEGELTNPTGRGDLRLIKSNFRANSVPDSRITFRTNDSKVEMNLSLMGDTLKGTMARKVGKSGEWGLNLNFEQFDFAPVVTILMGKDIPNLSSIIAAGDLNLTGVLKDWRTYRGSGELRKLNLGLKGTPMFNESPFQIKVQDGSFKISRVNLIGKDSQISGDFNFEPEKSIRSSIDGKLDLQFLQPFIPGLDYGAGKVSVGVRISGHPKNFNMLGNVALEDGTIRFTGLLDEMKNAQAQLSVSQDRINVDKFEANVNGGKLNIGGDVRINRFSSLIPNLTLNASRVAMRMGSFLNARFSGDFFIRGNDTPYLLGGRCRIVDAALTKFAIEDTAKAEVDPIFKFDVTCEGKEKLMVDTDVMNAEFKGNFHLLGDNVDIGVLGTAEAIQGSLIFRQTKFTLNSGTVRFESAKSIAPRFAVGGKAYVKELKGQGAQEYEVNLQVVGTPAQYRPILTSNPVLSEADITSLLLLGVTSTTRAQNQEGSFLDLGTAVVGQIPLQSKIESQLGVDIRVNSQANKQLTTAGTGTTTTNAASTGTLAGNGSVPAVQIQKDITKRTKVSYSNTLQVVPTRELRIEHLLDDNLTVNGTAVDKLRDGTDSQTVQSFGIDFRYRFQFE